MIAAALVRRPGGCCPAHRVRRLVATHQLDSRFGGGPRFGKVFLVRNLSDGCGLMVLLSCCRYLGQREEVMMSTAVECLFGAVILSGSFIYLFIWFLGACNSPCLVRRVGDCIM